MFILPLIDSETAIQPGPVFPIEFIFGKNVYDKAINEVDLDRFFPLPWDNEACLSLMTRLSDSSGGGNICCCGPKTKGKPSSFLNAQIHTIDFNSKIGHWTMYRVASKSIDPFAESFLVLEFDGKKIDTFIPLLSAFTQIFYR